MFSWLIAAGAAPASNDALSPPAEAGPDSAEVVDSVLGTVDHLIDGVAAMPVDLLIEKTAWSAAVVAAAFGLRLLTGRLIDSGHRHFTHELDKKAKRQATHDSADGLASLLRSAASAVLALIAVGMVAVIWGVNLATWLLQDVNIAEKMLSIGLIILFSAILLRLLTAGLDFLFMPKFSRRRRRGQKESAHSLMALLKAIARIVVFIFAGLLVLAELGLDITPLLAGAGIIGLAIGFGSQSLVKDFLTGITLLIEGTLKEGDIVQAAGHFGEVRELRIRTMRLRDLEGVVHTVPYSEIGTIQNYSHGHAFALMDIGVHYRTSLDDVTEIVEATVAEMREDAALKRLIWDDPEILGLDEFADSALMIKVRIKCAPGQQWTVRRAFNGILKRRFDAAGIEIPFPIRTLYFGPQEEQGTAQMRMVRYPANDPAGGRNGGKDETARAAE